MCVFVSFLKVYMWEVMRNRKFSWYGLTLKHQSFQGQCGVSLVSSWKRMYRATHLSLGESCSRAFSRERRVFWHTGDIISMVKFRIANLAGSFFMILGWRK